MTRIRAQNLGFGFSGFLGPRIRILRILRPLDSDSRWILRNFRRPPAAAGRFLAFSEVFSENLLTLFQISAEHVTV